MQIDIEIKIKQLRKKRKPLLNLGCGYKGVIFSTFLNISNLL